MQAVPHPMDRSIHINQAVFRHIQTNRTIRNDLVLNNQITVHRTNQAVVAVVEVLLHINREAEATVDHINRAVEVVALLKSHAAVVVAEALHKNQAAVAEVLQINRVVVAVAVAQHQKWLTVLRLIRKSEATNGSDRF